MKPTSKLSGLEVLTFVALLVNACAYFVYFFLVFSIAGVIFPLLGIAILTLLAALFVAMRVRIAPLLGALLAAAMSILDLAQPESVYNLEHPAIVSYFLVGVIVLASALVGGRGRRPELPRYQEAAARGVPHRALRPPFVWPRPLPAQWSALASHSTPCATARPSPQGSSSRQGRTVAPVLESS
jgi:hypothetical protein